MDAILNEIAVTYQLIRKAGKWVGKCPKCGGSDGSDRFQIRDDGGFKCYGCEFKGDIITWLREMEGKSCPDAHQAAQMDCRVGAACNAWGSCRYGDGSGKGVLTNRPRPLTIPEEEKPPALASCRPGSPDPLWLAWGNRLVAEAAAEIPNQKGANTWLASRGIDQATVTANRLGWVKRDSKIDRASIGLSPEKNGKKTLWIPSGLLIPIFDAQGNLHRIRIRRSAWTREKFLPSLKYVWIEGSGKETMYLSPAGKMRGAVIVEAELDGEACAAAHDQVLVVALGTVQGGLTDDLRNMLAAAPVILVALDAELGKDGGKGPGPKAVASWLHEYRQAKFWPVPAGKDPGDYVKEHGGDLRVWIDAGLPPVVSIPAGPPHDPMSTPDCKSLGGAGRHKNALPENSSGMEEIVELVGLLNRLSGVICVGDARQSMGVKYQKPLDAQNRIDRLRVNDLVYRGKTAMELLSLLPDGRWNGQQLAKWSGMGKNAAAE